MRRKIGGAINWLFLTRIATYLAVIAGACIAAIAYAHSPSHERRLGFDVFLVMTLAAGSGLGIVRGVERMGLTKKQTDAEAELTRWKNLRVVLEILGFSFLGGAVTEIAQRMFPRYETTFIVTAAAVSAGVGGFVALYRVVSDRIKIARENAVKQEAERVAAKKLAEETLSKELEAGTQIVLLEILSAFYDLSRHDWFNEFWRRSAFPAEQTREAILNKMVNQLTIDKRVGVDGGRFFAPGPNRDDRPRYLAQKVA